MRTGLVLSVLLHAGLLYWYATATPRHADADADEPADPRNPIVWMAAPRPAPSAPPRPPALAHNANPHAAPPQHQRASPAPARKAGEANAASAPLQPEAITLTADTPTAAAPKFDINLALKSARAFAGARATKDDAAVAQLQDKPINELRSESVGARAIEKAARADCKTVASGAGLLALIAIPVILLTDKKDSGCKW